MKHELVRLHEPKVDFKLKHSHDEQLCLNNSVPSEPIIVAEFERRRRAMQRVVGNIDNVADFHSVIFNFSSQVQASRSNQLRTKKTSEFVRKNHSHLHSDHNCWGPLPWKIYGTASQLLQQKADPFVVSHLQRVLRAWIRKTGVWLTAFENEPDSEKIVLLVYIIDRIRFPLSFVTLQLQHINYVFHFRWKLIISASMFVVCWCKAKNKMAAKQWYQLGEVNISKEKL